ncbi:hypothetical protein NLJ89_g11708 [Agrocybe chaxingu]|uniref:STAG domain-containing protein n=1 Tax=Agrocybe chaxingu TaxID=84603 RepID=A0A9W8JWA1_9AGAR|nr:hypothetical protein NLJ89_g11708 [Agrocybe chaxingu]
MRTTLLISMGFFRYTATVIALEAETAPCDVAAAVDKEKDVVSRQQEGEKKRKTKGTNQRLQELVLQEKEVKQRLSSVDGTNGKKCTDDFVVDEAWRLEEKAEEESVSNDITRALIKGLAEVLVIPTLVNLDLYLGNLRSKQAYSSLWDDILKLEDELLDETRLRLRHVTFSEDEVLALIAWCTRLSTVAGARDMTAWIE